MDAGRDTAPRKRNKPTGRCKHCGRHTYGGATACKSRMCDGYAPLWAGDWRRVFFDNLGTLRELVPTLPPGLEAKAVMLAVTAPGAETVWDAATGEVISAGMPWDRVRCTHSDDETCSGPKGCRVVKSIADEWNRRTDLRWSQLHRRAATETRRMYGNDSLVLLARVKEMQKRGLVHWHPVLLAATPSQRKAVAHYRLRLEQLAAQYGFGYVSQKLKPSAGKAAAAYLSSYFVTGKKEKAKLQDSVREPALRRGRLIWLTPKLTLKTGVTMRELRFRRFVWANYSVMLQVGGKWIGVARALAELQRENGGADWTREELLQLLSQDEWNELMLTALGRGVVRFAP
jgi:hypothetical protein